MERIAQVWRARPGMAEEYRRFHATVWPEVEQMLRDVGVHHFEIYAWGDVMFAHIEVEDAAAMNAALADHPTSVRWEAEVSRLIEYDAVDPQTGAPATLPVVWSL